MPSMKIGKWIEKLNVISCATAKRSGEKIERGLRKKNDDVVVEREREHEEAEKEDGWMMKSA
jgi:hypothetical protein